MSRVRPVVAVILLCAVIGIAFLVPYLPNAFQRGTGPTTTETTTDTTGTPPCPWLVAINGSLACYGAIALGDSYFTGINATFTFTSYSGANDSFCGGNACFSLQLNSNYYNDSWYQLAVGVGTSGAGRMEALLGEQFWWLGNGTKSGPCVGEQQWVLSTNHAWWCPVAVLGSIDVGGPRNVTGSLAISLRLLPDARQQVLLVYREANGTVAGTLNGTLRAPAGFDPYGKITSFRPEVVGIGVGSNADFAKGTVITMVMWPVLNTGTAYGKDWSTGDLSPPSLETSNLAVAAQYAGDHESASFTA